MPTRDDNLPTRDDIPEPATAEEAPVESPLPGSGRRFAAALIVLAIFITPAVGFFWLRSMSQNAVEFAVVSHAQNMLNRHMARTGGQWPASWDDLAEDFEPADANYDTPSLAAMKEQVAIDFAPDLSALRAADSPAGPPPRLIWLHGRNDPPVVEAANTQLAELLRHRLSASD